MKEFVFCVDSDGCAMDTMDIKHKMFFGPIAADIFNIQDRETFLYNWYKINLYSKTRGVNRFVGLLKTLDSVNYPNIENLRKWIEETKELSNKSLSQEIQKNKAKDLELALEWSEKVNENIPTLEDKDHPFENVKDTLAKMSEYGDIMIVSSANKESVISEWQRHKLFEHVKDTYCQDRGKKEDVIAQIIQSGVAPSKIFMVGDSPGDLKAAEKNNVNFYPILVGKEADSWLLLQNEVLNKIVSNQFDAKEQEKYNEMFWANLED